MGGSPGRRGRARRSHRPTAIGGTAGGSLLAQMTPQTARRRGTAATTRRDAFWRLPVKDLHGLTISTSSADAGAAMERALSSFLKFRLDAREHLSRSLAADPEFGLAHCLKGYFAMLLYKQAGVAPAAQSARTARALVAKATAREQSHVDALEAWVA